MRNVGCVVFLSGSDIVDENSYILVVMHFIDRLTIDQVPLQLRVLDVEYVLVELLQLGIRHFVLVQRKPVTEDYFELFGADVPAAVHQLTAEGIDVIRLGAVFVSVLAEDFGHFIAICL